MDSPPLDETLDSSLSVKRLKKILQEKDLLITSLNDDISALLNNNFENSVTAKVADLVRRNRSLQLALEKERTISSEAKYEVERLTSLLNSHQSTTNPPEHQDTDKVIKSESQDRLNGALRRIGELSTMLEKYKSENSKLTRVLHKELGNIPLETALASLEKGGSWKGRAEKIHNLKSQISALQLQVCDQTTDISEANTTISTVTTASLDTRQSRELDTLRLAKEKARRESEETIVLLREEVASEKQKHKAVLSRVTILEKEIQDMKGHLKTVLTKTQNDNLFIDALQREIKRLNGAIDGSVLEELESTKKRLAMIEKKYSTLLHDVEVGRREEEEERRNSRTSSHPSRSSSVASVVTPDNVSKPSTALLAFQVEIEALKKVNSELRQRLTEVESLCSSLESRLNTSAGVESTEFSSVHSVLLEKRMSHMESELAVYQQLVDDLHDYLLEEGPNETQMFVDLQQQLKDLQLRMLSEGSQVGIESI
ncbi:hypothetical protein RCL1_006837 [Eukaryota sp. TZLM3-RCL]